MGPSSGLLRASQACPLHHPLTAAREPASVPIVPSRSREGQILVTRPAFYPRPGCCPVPSPRRARASAAGDSPLHSEAEGQPASWSPAAAAREEPGFQRRLRGKGDDRCGLLLGVQALCPQGHQHGVCCQGEPPSMYLGGGGGSTRANVAFALWQGGLAPEALGGGKGVWLDASPAVWMQEEMLLHAPFPLRSSTRARGIPRRRLRFFCGMASTPTSSL